MESPLTTPISATDGVKTVELRRLSLAQLKRVDHMLEQLGDFGEVRLIVEKGAIKFVEVVVSRRV